MAHGCCYHLDSQNFLSLSLSKPSVYIVCRRAEVKGGTVAPNIFKLLQSKLWPVNGPNCGIVSTLLCLQLWTQDVKSKVTEKCH